MQVGPFGSKNYDICFANKFPIRKLINNLFYIENHIGNRKYI